MAQLHREPAEFQPVDRGSESGTVAPLHGVGECPQRVRIVGQPRGDLRELVRLRQVRARRRELDGDGQAEPNASPRAQPLADEVALVGESQPGQDVAYGVRRAARHRRLNLRQRLRIGKQRAHRTSGRRQFLLQRCQLYGLRRTHHPAQQPAPDPAHPTAQHVPQRLGLRLAQHDPEAIRVAVRHRLRQLLDQLLVAGDPDDGVDELPQIRNLLRRRSGQLQTH